MRMIIDRRLLDKNFFTTRCNRYITEWIQVLQKEKPQMEFCYYDDSFSRKEMRSDDILLRIGGAQSGSIQKIPDLQLVWLPGMEEKDFSKKRYFLRFRKKLPEIFKQAACVFIDSENSRKNLPPDLRQRPGITVIPHVGDEDCHPASLGEKEHIKMQYAIGRDYFLVIQNGPPFSDLIELLKAFSQFKRRQLSGMQFVIVGSSSNIERKFIEQLGSFKYRDDVHIYDNSDEAELKKMVSSAYVLLQPVEDPDMMLNAFRMKVPVILDKKNYNDATSGLVVQAPFDDHDQLARQLILLYTNEYFRNELIRKASAKATLSNHKTQVKQIWDIIQDVIKRDKNENLFLEVS